MAEDTQQEPGEPIYHAGKDAPKLLGLAAATLNGSFTCTESVISVLYDRYQIAWNNGQASPDSMIIPDFYIAASESARGLPLTLCLRGFCMPAGAGTLHVVAGGEAILASPEEESWQLTVTGRLHTTGEPTRVAVMLDLPGPADGAAALLQLDSIDISLSLPGGGAEEEEEEEEEGIAQ